MSGTTPLPMPLEPTPPVHIISPSAPAPAHQLQEPVSPPAPPSSPQATSSPEAVSGTVSERSHAPLPEPAAPPSAPLPSVDPTQQLLPHNQLPSGFTMTPTNDPAPGLVPPPSPGREGVPERVQPNGTASSQESVDPTAQYMRPPVEPEPDPLSSNDFTHNPY